MQFMMSSTADMTDSHDISTSVVIEQVGAKMYDWVSKEVIISYAVFL